MHTDDCENVKADRDRWRLVAENKCKARMEEQRLKFETLAELDEANARIHKLKHDNVALVTKIRELESRLGETA